MPVSIPELEARQRWAAESILNSEALTDNLADAEADRLLRWAVGRAEALARETAALRPAEAQSVLEERLATLRQLVSGINRLAGGFRPVEPARVPGRLARLAAAAAALGLACPGEEALEAYTRQQDGLGTGARLEWLLRLFGEGADPAPMSSASDSR